MSRITAIFGSDNDDEIMNDLYLIANVRIYIYSKIVLGLKFLTRTRWDLDSFTSRKISTITPITHALGLHGQTVILRR